MSNNMLMGFNEFTKNSNMMPLNEMASSLTKIGVPKDLMKFIHKLSGNLKNIDYNRGFATLTEPRKSKGGPYPQNQDQPLSHDVEVIGTKSGKKNIFHYLTNVINSRKDTEVRLILANPESDTIMYITRKTGKLSRAQMDAEGIVDTDDARRQGTSNKRGLYLRVGVIDADSGLPIAAWGGTIGQIKDQFMSDDSVLYIMETEDRVKEKRKTRTSRKHVSKDTFIQYFIDHYTNILQSMGKSNADKLGEKLMQKMSGLSPQDLAAVLSQGYGEGRVRGNRTDGESAAKVREILDLQKAIENNVVSTGNIEVLLHKFLELAFKDGAYESDENDSNRASISDMVNKHTMPIVASMFVQYAALGKVYKPFYTDDPFKELGLDDLLF